MIKQSDLNKVMRFIEEFVEDNGYFPSVREICLKMNFKSTATAHNYLKRLQDAGMIQKTDNKKRAVKLSGDQRRIPLLGTVTAGATILAYENYEDYYSLPVGEFKGDQLFMLRVQGDSMIEAGIFNGDKIIVRQQPVAENGEIVVALIDDSATVKRFYKKDGYFILHPENQALSDIIVENVDILGKVIGLIRSDIN